MVIKCMGFASKNVWVMGYQGVMGYGFKSPAYQLGGSKNVWVTREYGLSGLWVMRESTVSTRGFATLGYICDIIRNSLVLGRELEVG
jgi:hypothetical protein